jgi:hypothetical protein
MYDRVQMELLNEITFLLLVQIFEPRPPLGKKKRKPPRNKTKRCDSKKMKRKDRKEVSLDALREE